MLHIIDGYKECACPLCDRIRELETKSFDAKEQAHQEAMLRAKATARAEALEAELTIKDQMLAHLKATVDELEARLTEAEKVIRKLSDGGVAWENGAYRGCLAESELEKAEAKLAAAVVHHDAEHHACWNWPPIPDSHPPEARDSGSKLVDAPVNSLRTAAVKASGAPFVACSMECGCGANCCLESGHEEDCDCGGHADGAPAKAVQP